MKYHNDDFESFKKELLKDKEVLAEYNRLGPEFEIIQMILDARKQKGITQKELAEKMGTKQSAIARLEAGNANPSIGFLQKLARALDKKLEMTFSSV
ncbi:MAG: helix-turn-helix transcriptional regulator [bacterium]|nr:helix-turn-helix transcriptional regulator [bacterium]